jgi:hypothetical protein
VGAADVDSRTTDHNDADPDDDHNHDEPDRDDRNDRADAAHVHGEQPDIAHIIAHVDHPGSGHHDVAAPSRAGPAVARAAAPAALAATVHSASTATLACRDDHP